MEEAIVPPGLEARTQAVKALLAERCQVQGIFLRGSHARGDALPFSDFDLVALVDRMPLFTSHPGLKIIQYSSAVDEARILENPVRPLDFRDSRILFDPHGLLEELKRKCIAELQYPKRVGQRSRKLLTSAQGYLSCMQACSLEDSLPNVTGLILEAVRAILIYHSITPSGRRLLFQLSLINTPAIREIKELIAMVLGVKAMAPASAETFFANVMHVIEQDTGIDYTNNYGRFLTSERLYYWQEGFEYLIALDTTAACWVSFSVLVNYHQYCSRYAAGNPLSGQTGHSLFAGLNGYTFYDLRKDAAVLLLDRVEQCTPLEQGSKI